MQSQCTLRSATGQQSPKLEWNAVLIVLVTLLFGQPWQLTQVSEDLAN